MPVHSFHLLWCGGNSVHKLEYFEQVCSPMKRGPSGWGSLLKEGLGMCWEEPCLGVAGDCEVRYGRQELAVVVAL